MAEFVKNHSFFNRYMFSPPKRTYTLDMFRRKHLIWIPQEHRGPLPCLFVAPPKKHATKIRNRKRRRSSSCDNIPSAPPVPDALDQMVCQWKRGDYLIIYANSNSMDLASSYEFVKRMAHKLHVYVVCFEYTGFGFALNKGEQTTPTEASTQRDIRVTYNFVRQTLNWPAERIIIYGEAIGCGIASYCASYAQEKLNETVAALCLRSSFTSIEDIVKYYLGPVSTFVLNRFNNVKFLKNVKSPLLIMHGELDNEIPLALSKKLLSTYKGHFLRKLHIAQGEGHHMVEYSNVFIPIAQFLLDIQHSNDLLHVELPPPHRIKLPDIVRAIPLEFMRATMPEPISASVRSVTAQGFNTALSLLSNKEIAMESEAVRLTTDEEIKDYLNIRITKFCRAIAANYYVRINSVQHNKMGSERQPRPVTPEATKEVRHIDSDPTGGTLSARKRNSFPEITTIVPEKRERKKKPRRDGRSSDGHKSEDSSADGHSDSNHINSTKERETKMPNISVIKNQNNANEDSLDDSVLPQNNNRLESKHTRNISSSSSTTEETISRINKHKRGGSKGAGIDVEIHRIEKQGKQPSRRNFLDPQKKPKTINYASESKDDLLNWVKGQYCFYAPLLDIYMEIEQLHVPVGPGPVPYVLGASFKAIGSAPYGLLHVQLRMGGLLYCWDRKSRAAPREMNFKHVYNVKKTRCRIPLFLISVPSSFFNELTSWLQKKINVDLPFNQFLEDIELHLSDVISTLLSIAVPLYTGLNFAGDDIKLCDKMKEWGVIVQKWEKEYYYHASCANCQDFFMLNCAAFQLTIPGEANKDVQRVSVTEFPNRQGALFKASPFSQDINAHVNDIYKGKRVMAPRFESVEEFIQNFQSGKIESPDYVIMAAQWYLQTCPQYTEELCSVLRRACKAFRKITKECHKNVK